MFGKVNRVVNSNSFVKSLVGLSLAFAILSIFLSSSGVFNSSSNSFIVSALADDTAVFAAFLACLHLCTLAFVVFLIFIASFLALITSCTLPFHHHYILISLGPPSSCRSHTISVHSPRVVLYPTPSPCIVL